MSPIYADSPSGFQLPGDDRHSIQALYGPPDHPIEPEPTLPTPRTPQTTQEPKSSPSTTPSGPRREDPCARKVVLDESEPDHYFDHVDAAFETAGGADIVLFNGSHYYWLNGRNLLAYDNGALQNLGLGSHVLKVDAAFIWVHNGRTYFFSGDQYLRLDFHRRMIDDDYPRHFGVWQGLPSNPHLSSCRHASVASGRVVQYMPQPLSV
ncbi:collagenase 3-like [Oratosquilla oratoria]|uniref:collagenase 3-like n=1 Tax=Oratosquilla oratoria TaxID=337810 RepID=UPI003F772322